MQASYCAAKSYLSEVPTLCPYAEGYTPYIDRARGMGTSRGRGNFSMHRNTSRENREIPWSPVKDGAAGRIGKSKDASQ